MDNLISRQAAIDAVSKGCQELRGVFSRCEENILALPSAQPEPCEDAVNRSNLRLMKAEECAGHTIEYAMGWKACIEWIKTLPSAQQRSCEYWDTESNYCALNRPSAQPERKMGRWIVVSDGYGNGEATACICECSECKDTIWVYKKSNRKWNFCSNCGARMEVEHDA